MLRFVTLGLLALTSLPNSPYPKQPTLVPSLELELAPLGMTYLTIENSARCVPDALLRWNPITALWKVEAGVELHNFRMGIGHQSEHGIDKEWVATESRDYFLLRVKFR